MPWFERARGCNRSKRVHPIPWSFYVVFLASVFMALAGSLVFLCSEAWPMTGYVCELMGSICSRLVRIT